MKMSTKARYGLYVAVQLAEKYEGGEMVRIPYLSEVTGVSEGYLEQIMALLRKEGIVESARGAAGGYRLSAAPKEISVGRVLRSVEGNLLFVDCLSDECKRGEVGVSHALWKGLYDVINGYLDSVSLEKLIQEGENE